MSNDVYIGLRAADLDISEPASVISKVVLTKDSETEYVAGNDSGRTLKVSHPWGSQAMADSILASVKDYVYKPYTAKDAILDPAAEIGDFVTVGGVYSTIADMDTEMNSLFQVTIKAPKSDEIDDEYPYSSSPEKVIERKIKGAYSQIAKTNERIDLEVGAVDKKVAALNVSVDGIEGSVKNLENGMGHTLRLTEDGLTVTDSEGKAVTIGGGQIDAKTIKTEDLYLTGMITFEDLANDAKTAIDNAAPRYQYSADGSSNWHSTMQSTDYYRRESYDGGNTWGAVYQFRGRDGKNGDKGEDAVIPTYISDTIIGTGMIQAPQIYGNDINLYPNNQNDYFGSFNIFGMQGASQFHMLKIAYAGNRDSSYEPTVDFYSPGDAKITFNNNHRYGMVKFYGIVDLSEADTRGFHLTFS